MKKTAIIIQARMGSTRLPGKIMKKILNKPMIEYLIERASKSKMIDDIIVATSDTKENKELVDFLKAKSVKYFIGDENDVLSRYYYTAKKFNIDNIIRVTADCPLIDATIIDDTVKKYYKDKVDYASNIFPRSFPKGLDTEIFSFNSIEKAFNEANSLYDREHVTPYIRESGKFDISNISYEKDYSYLRLTVDWEEDFKLISKIFNQFKPNIFFNWLDVVDELFKNPELIQINNHLK
tara:strand:+ start:33 stop:743 length:711 start_codon:yes stop_codon:yes gene_type:complete